MLDLIRKITGSEMGELHRGVAFAVLENGAVAGGLAFFSLFFMALQGGADARLQWIWFAGVCLCFVARVEFSVAGFTRSITAAYRITAGVRLRLGDHFRKLPMGFFSRKDLGALSNAVLQDTSLIDFLFSHILVVLISSILLPVFIACVLISLDATLFAVAVIPVLLALPVLAKSRRIIKEQGARRLSFIDKTDSAVLEYIQGIRVMKSHGVVGAQNRKLMELVTELSRKSIRIETATLGQGLIFAAIVDFGFALLLLASALLYNAGQVTGVTAILFLVIAYRFYAPFLDLMQFSILAQYVVNAAKRIEELLEQPQLPCPEAPLEPGRFDIEFSDVSFAYDANQVLGNVSFQAREKSMTALVGPSGSGKTTITNLMALFWDTYQGEIRIGGVDIRRMDPERLLGLFAFVFQDVYLFSDSVINNIRVGNSAASREEVIEAAKKAHCHEFVSRMSEGYDTMVGEGGCTLSGGEKQRISIARALLKDAPIIVLDEATTSLDPVNEKLVQRAVEALVRSKTLIVIAHRLRTVTRADQIVVLERGKVVERGTHRELLARQGRYQAMWDSMTGRAGAEG